MFKARYQTNTGCDKTMDKWGLHRADSPVNHVYLCSQKEQVGLAKDKWCKNLPNFIPQKQKQEDKEKQNGEKEKATHACIGL